MADEKADEQSRIPSALDCSNIVTTWPKWKQNFIVWMIATGKMDKPEKDKIASFIWLIGEQGREIYNKLFPNDGTEDSMFETRSGTHLSHVKKRSLKEVLERFNQHCKPPEVCSTIETFKFNMIHQKENQSFEEFEAELRKQLPLCKFICTCGVSYESRMLRDRIISGVYDKKLQLELLNGLFFHLQRVLDFCYKYEITKKNKILLESKATVDASITAEENKNNSVASSIKRFCFKCGHDWSRKHTTECKAKNIRCYKCSEIGHYAKMCSQSGHMPLKKDNNNENICHCNKKEVDSIANKGDIEDEDHDEVEIVNQCNSEILIAKSSERQYFQVTPVGMDTERQQAVAVTTKSSGTFNSLSNQTKIPPAAHCYDFAFNDNTIPVIPPPSMEGISLYFAPQFLKTGIQILNNFSVMFAKILDSMENPTLPKNSTTPTNSSVSSNLNKLGNYMQRDGKISKQKEQTHKQNKDNIKTGSDASSRVEIDDLDSDSDNESVSRSFVEVYTPLKQNASTPPSATSETAVSSAQTKSPQTLNKSNAVDFVLLYADLEAHIAREAANASIKSFETITDSAENAKEALMTITSTAAPSDPTTTTSISTTTLNTYTHNDSEDKGAVPMLK